MDRHLDAIDGLRGIAIALVVAYHSWLVYGSSLGLLSQAGFLGVELFFALSGFCMFYPFARAKFFGTPAPEWGQYAYRRAIKIVPSYLVALTVFALCYARRDGSDHTAIGYAAHVLFVHPLLPHQFQSISGPLWTIGVEVQFYLIFPLLASLFVRRPLLGAATVAVVATAYRVAVLLVNPDPGFFPSNQVIAFLDLFGAGMLAAYAVAWAHSRPAHVDIRPAATAVAVTSVVVAGAGMVAFARSDAMTDSSVFFVWQLHWRLAIAVVLFALVAATTLALPTLRRIVANPVTTFLAVVSYNLYLWHLEILAFGQREGLALPVALFGAIAVAAAVTYGLERPLLAARFFGTPARRQSVQTA
ncbi:MAG: acyltransferase [Candidatus Eremiobacteraeota bacterium]|nr:acyltransferase [Candidatus Eremiobacteraeota bacterium]MBV8721458.1 acyltransferase [Candidatus Eremiobacteraeota bacterium]